MINYSSLDTLSCNTLYLVLICMLSTANWMKYVQEMRPKVNRGHTDSATDHLIGYS